MIMSAFWRMNASYDYKEAGPVGNIVAVVIKNMQHKLTLLIIF